MVLTNSVGLATFKTIFPGRYTGRSPHIHAKVSLIQFSRQSLSCELFFIVPCGSVIVFLIVRHIVPSGTSQTYFGAQPPFVFLFYCT